MIFINASKYEHFGVNVGEAMACCVPIVYKNGGPWHDILERKELYGYAYSSLTEAITKIEVLLNDSEHYVKKALIALERSKAFIYEKFSESLRELLLDLNLDFKREGAKL